MGTVIQCFSRKLITPSIFALRCFSTVSRVVCETLKKQLSRRERVELFYFFNAPKRGKLPAVVALSGAFGTPHTNRVLCTDSTPEDFKPRLLRIFARAETAAPREAF